MNLWTEYDGYPPVVYEAHSSFIGNEAKQLCAAVWQFEPKNLVEIGLGWTTHIMLAAMRHDSRLTTYAIDPWASVPADVRWNWVGGDVRNTWVAQPDIDLLVIDAEHSASFAQWCQQTVLRDIRPNIPVMIHDWLPGRPHDWNTEEAAAWDQFIETHPEWKIDYAFGWDKNSGLSSVWMHKE